MFKIRKTKENIQQQKDKKIAHFFKFFIFIYF